jgi:hypothetical protein
MEENKRKIDDQAKELRSILNELHSQSDDNSDERIEVEHEDEQKEINVLDLPPRKEVHGQKKRRAHVKLSKPLIRLVVVAVLLIIILIMLLYFGDGIVTF